MGFFRKQIKKFYCAFCRSDRSILSQSHVQFFEIVICFAASLILMLIFWQQFNFKFIPIFALLIVFTEFLIQIKQRLLLTCPHCGFDPVLYKRSPGQCAEKVKLHLQKRQNDPSTLLSKKPKLDLPYLKKNAKLEEKMTTAVRKSSQGSKLDVRL